LAEAWGPQKKLLSAESTERKKNAEKTGNAENLAGRVYAERLLFSSALV
jgi:hypothetical protein